MTTSRFSLPVTLCLCLALPARAATLNSDGSQRDTAAKIAAATNGDTVLLPSGGSFTWALDVAIPNTKHITLDGNGATIALSATLTLNPHATGNTRITNFTFACGAKGHIALSDTPTTACFRLDHCKITGSRSSIVSASGRGAGLIDHCVFTGLNWAQEFLYAMGWDNVTSTGWTTAVTPGSASMLYIEDCEFHASTGGQGVAWLMGYYGTRVCIRHNLFDWVSVDMHGTTTNIGARWWECYENTFTNDSTGSQPNWAFSFRAGSGVIFNNASIGRRPVNIGLLEEDSGYPADYQIGRGINQSLDPAYVWNNRGMTLSLNHGDASPVAGMVKLDRDVHASPKPDYTPYAYPHPLRGEARR